MKDTENVTLVKNVTITDVYIGDVRETANGVSYCQIICRLDQDVPAMVKVTKAIIDDAVATATSLADAAKAMPATTDEEKAAKADAKAKATAAKQYADSLELDEYVVGKNNTIFLSNFDFINMLRQDPELKFLIDAVQADETIFKGILNYAKINVICEKVYHDEEYRSPFSTSSETTTVPNDSVYHSGYNLQLSKYGQEAASEVKAILADITKARIMAKLQAATKKRAAKNDAFDDSED